MYIFLRIFVIIIFFLFYFIILMCIVKNDDNILLIIFKNYKVICYIIKDFNIGKIGLNFCKY